MPKRNADGISLRVSLTVVGGMVAFACAADSTPLDDACSSLGSWDAPAPELIEIDEVDRLYGPSFALTGDQLYYPLSGVRRRNLTTGDDHALAGPRAETRAWRILDADGSRLLWAEIGPSLAVFLQTAGSASQQPRKPANRS